LEQDIAQSVETWVSDPMVVQLAVLVVGLLAIALAVRLLHRGLTRYVRGDTTRYQMRKFVTLLGYVVAIVFSTIVFSNRLGGITVALGVAGAGVAFALQEVIASVAGWVAILFGGFYKVGDRVELGGIKGDVIDIGILRTTVMQIGEWVDADQYNGRIVRIANSFVFKEPVFNYSGEFPFVWDEITVPVKYGSDHAEARGLLFRVAEEVVGDYGRSAEAAWEPITRRYLVETASVRPMVTMVATADWIEFTLRYVVHYRARRTTKDQIFTRVLEEIDRTGDRVGIAAATLNIEKVAPLDIRLRRASREG